MPQEKESKILDYVMKLLDRMKTDWISQGRRPTGLIGASFWIAFKCFSIERSFTDIAETLKISEETIRKRVNEFKVLKVARLTKEEFIELKDCDMNFLPEDPPSFKNSKHEPESQQQLEMQLSLDI